MENLDFLENLDLCKFRLFFEIFSKDKHTGSVNSLDLNPFQANLLASGASDSEIYIWDLNKDSMPMTPGAKAQPLEDVRCVSWNRQVQHILATTGKILRLYKKYFNFLGTIQILRNQGTGWVG